MRCASRASSAWRCKTSIIGAPLKVAIINESTKRRIVIELNSLPIPSKARWNGSPDLTRATTFLNSIAIAPLAEIPIRSIAAIGVSPADKASEYISITAGNSDSTLS